MTAIIDELRLKLDSGSVLEEQEIRTRARNYWDSSPLQALALLRPRSTQEVSAIMKICFARGQTVVVHGGLTGVCDGDRATPQDVILSLERMTQIEDIDTIGRTVVVQSGCTLQSLQAAVEQEGMQFPLDLGARGSCTLGGNVSTNAGGINVIRYGMTRALVLGLEAVLPDGTIVSSMNRMLKNNTGYDTKQLFIGSEGTLGIVTRVVLALKEQTTSVNTALVATGNGENVLHLLKIIDRRLGGTLTSFEAMWGNYFRAVTEPGWHTAPMDRKHNFYVLIEARGSDQEEDSRRFMRAVEEVFEAGLVLDAVFPKSESERHRLWSIRENFEAILQQKPIFLYDISVPLRHMIAYVEEVTKNLQGRWPASAFYVLGHIGDGNLHFFLSPNGTSDSSQQLRAEADRIVFGPLPRFFGAISAEHGIGLEKKAWMALSRSPAEIELMRTLKRALDPKCILNRGKVIDMPAQT